MRGSMPPRSAFYGTHCRPTERVAKLSTEFHLWDYSFGTDYNFVDGIEFCTLTKFILSTE